MITVFLNVLQNGCLILPKMKVIISITEKSLFEKDFYIKMNTSRGHITFF